MSRFHASLWVQDVVRGSGGAVHCCWRFLSVPSVRVGFHSFLSSHPRRRSRRGWSSAIPRPRPPAHVRAWFHPRAVHMIQVMWCWSTTRPNPSSDQHEPWSSPPGCGCVPRTVALEGDTGRAAPTLVHRLPRGGSWGSLPLPSDRPRGERPRLRATRGERRRDRVVACLPRTGLRTDGRSGFPSKFPFNSSG